MEIKVVGLDIGKTWFHFVGCNRAGKPIQRYKFNRTKLTRFMANLPPCLVGLEACAGSQHLARLMGRQGHEVRLIAPKFIKAYLKSQKNDFNDAEAIAEAVTRPTMRFVTMKSNEQLDLQAVHRIRERMVRERTSTINQIRAFLIEYGIPVRKGRPALRKELPSILGSIDSGLSDKMIQLIGQLQQHWRYLDDSIERHTSEIEQIAKQDEACKRLVRIPGVGPLGATAMISAIGNGAAFKRGREFASWLGLVPLQRSTGGKQTFLGISKRGNTYVRKLLIHGARSLMKHLTRNNHRLGAWITGLEQRAHKNVVAVALANKIARISWAVLARGQEYEPFHGVPV